MKKNFNKIIIFFLILSMIFFSSFADNKNILSISLDKNYISCSYSLNFTFSQTFIDMLYYNNQAEVNYSILLIKKITTPLLAQEQKMTEKKFQFFISYKNDIRIFTFFSSNDYFETNSIEKLFQIINNMKFKNVFSLDKPGIYYCSSTITITSLAPISPALFFLFLFYNPYNMKIRNLNSNTILYEISK